MDFFTVPTLRSRILYVFVILNHARRQALHIAVTERPTMTWTVQQLREATPFDQQPRYLLHDNDGIFGQEVRSFLESSGINNICIARQAPWQNPYVERFIGTLRRELLDHVIVLNERHLCRLLDEFATHYYHPARAHQGLGGQTPIQSHHLASPLDATVPLLGTPVCGGLHHRYLVSGT
jgi:transposase InsO family protein